MLVRLLLATVLACSCLASAADHNLAATPSTVVWGYYWSKAKPVLTIHSGDTVRMQTASSCPAPERLEAAGVRPADIPQYVATFIRR